MEGLLDYLTSPITAGVMGLAGLLFAVDAYWNARPRLKVTFAGPAYIGYGRVVDRTYQAFVSHVSLQIRNTGRAPASDVSGCITFANAATPIPLHLGSNPHTIRFEIQPHDHADLIAAWNVCEEGCVSATEIALREFVDQYLPATIEINYGRYKLVHHIKKTTTVRRFNESQRAIYKSDARRAR